MCLRLQVGLMGAVERYRQQGEGPPGYSPGVGKFDSSIFQGLDNLYPGQPRSRCSQMCSMQCHMPSHAGCVSGFPALCDQDAACCWGLGIKGELLSRVIGWVG